MSDGDLLLLLGKAVAYLHVVPLGPLGGIYRFIDLGVSVADPHSGLGDVAVYDDLLLLRSHRLCHLLAQLIPLWGGQPAMFGFSVYSSIEQAAIRKQVESGLNAFPTSSMGRLFDAVASICNVRQAVNYEGQAAIEFEALVDEAEEGCYIFEIIEDSVLRNTYCVKIDGVIRAVAADVRSGVPTPLIAARFHNGLAQLVLDLCEKMRRERGLTEVALSGGVWQNVTLLQKTLDRLRGADFVVYTHHLVPPNDGGLALGQAIIAASVVHC